MPHIRYATLASALLAFAASVSAQQPYGAIKADKDDRVTITGCVVRGEGGYLLTNVSEGRYDDHTARSSTFPPPSVAPAETPQLGQVLYWLKNDDKLEGHEGQRVEVEGGLEGELKKGEMEIERKGDRVEVEAKANGKKIKALLPETAAPIATSGDTEDKGDKKVELNYLMRRFEVKSVKMITSTCQ